MGEAFQAVRISDRVHWVGAVDWAIRNFHGYETSRGTSYNAYLIQADDVILVDTVKAPFQEEMIDRIASVVSPPEIRYIISNHAEMDHSGALPRLIELARPEKVFASKQGVRTLQQHFHWNRDVRAVEDGEQLSLGGANLRFVEARMLHWPDSMFTFLEEDGLLFTNDGFGMHLASTERFADQLDPAILKHEAAKYFANILLPYSPLVTKLAEKFPSLGLDVRAIAPDHGPVWRSDPLDIVRQWAGWAAQRPRKKAVIIYDTMWASTARMARAAGDGLAASGLSVKLLPLDVTHRSEVATELLDAGALLVGSPTMNNQIYPTVADVMTYLKGLKPKNLVGAAFGSYGWSGEAVRHLEAMLRDMDVEIVAEGLRTNYVPDAAALERCRALGSSVAEKLLERISRNPGVRA